MTKVKREINQYSEFKAKERFSEVSRQWILKNQALFYHLKGIFVRISIVNNF